MSGIHLVPSSGQFPQSRRQGPRVEVLDQLSGRLASTDLPVTIINLGFGGFAIESPVAFAEDERQLVQFIKDDVLSVTLMATCRYCHPIGGRNGAPHYAAGFEFEHDETGDTEAAVTMLVDIATSALAFQ